MVDRHSSRDSVARRGSEEEPPFGAASHGLGRVVEGYRKISGDDGECAVAVQHVGSNPTPVTEGTMAADEEHGIREGAYDNARGGTVLWCLCGEACRGTNWEEAGAELDAHLEEVGASEQ